MRDAARWRLNGGFDRMLSEFSKISKGFAGYAGSPLRGAFGYFDAETVRLAPVRNPFRANVLPM